MLLSCSLIHFWLVFSLCYSRYCWYSNSFRWLFIDLIPVLKVLEADFIVVGCCVYSQYQITHYVRLCIDDTTIAHLWVDTVFSDCVPSWYTFHWVFIITRVQITFHSFLYHGTCCYPHSVVQWCSDLFYLQWWSDAVFWSVAFMAMKAIMPQRGGHLPARRHRDAAWKPGGAIGGEIEGAEDAAIIRTLSFFGESCDSG